MKISEFRDEMNRLGKERIPFLFILDFELQKPVLIPLDRIDPAEILYDANGVTNSKAHEPEIGRVMLKKFPIPREEYQRKFDRVLNHLNYGDSFLTNLTVKTEITLNQSLRNVFHQSKAPYKLLFKDQFLVFSPEIFIQISGPLVRSYPMKGTIDAAVPGAREKILNDVKETSEHITIVDLIRNDLSQIAEDVAVTKFRYIDEIDTGDKRLLQVSSRIEGHLYGDYRSKLGEIMVRLLPAGSVSGAPKTKTLDIIRSTEGEERGYYTGVFGVFDGQKLDSGVMIRFIEKDGDRYYYRSGGGITTQSVASLEYQEIIDKVYVPIS